MIWTWTRLFISTRPGTKKVSKKGRGRAGNAGIRKGERSGTCDNLGGGRDEKGSQEGRREEWVLGETRKMPATEN